MNLIIFVCLNKNLNWGIQMGQKTSKNNIKRDTLLDIWIMLCSNRFRNDYSK